VPLSEHEQRVLREMEQALYRHDPRFATRVRDESVYRYAGRNLRWSIVGCAAGLAIMLASFTWSVLLAFVGVALLFGSSVGVATNLKRMGRAGLDDLTGSARPDDAGSATGTVGERLRRRFRPER
jgi:hypothetical protein